MHFKGFDDWVEIFKGGAQTDSKGNIHNGDDIIAKAVSAFDPKFHEPPVVVGHPKDNSPAFGWVSELKKKGNSLFAKFKQIVPEFEEAVKKGLYKKRSASFYQDGRLRHVGFLGGTPPAVKGLADLSFSDDDNVVTFEFSETHFWGWQTVADVFRKLREWLLEKEGKKIADTIIPNWDIKTVEDETKTEFNDNKPKKQESQMTTLEEKQLNDFMEKIEAAKKKAAKEERDKAEAEFAEKLEMAKKEAAKEERDKADAEFAEKQRKAKLEAVKKDIKTFCETKLEEGKIIPSWIKLGLQEFMENLDSENEIEFSEGNKKSRLDWFKDFLDDLPKVVVFGETVSRDKDIGAGEASVKLEQLIKNKMEKKEVGYNTAFAEVQNEYPDLVEEYVSEMKGVK